MQFLSRFGDGVARAAGSSSRELRNLPADIQCEFERRLNL
jgi:hypothetical protein